MSCAAIVAKHRCIFAIHLDYSVINFCANKPYLTKSYRYLFPLICPPFFSIDRIFIKGIYKRCASCRGFPLAFSPLVPPIYYAPFRSNDFLFLFVHSFLSASFCLSRFLRRCRTRRDDERRTSTITALLAMLTLRSANQLLLNGY